jgi:sialic acid synthase
MRELWIGGRRIADDEPPFVVAEIGNNHGASTDLAVRMIHVAAECGVDAVKLQKRDNKTLFTRALYDSPYNSEHAFGATYGQHREALEFGRGAYVRLRYAAVTQGLLFFATAFDVASADFLADLGVPAIKIASGDLSNTVLLQHCAGLGVPLIVSTGGHDLADVDRAVHLLQARRAEFCLLQCTAVYPTRHEQMHLRVVEAFRDRYPSVVIGLSDHQDGYSMAAVAWTLGARVFEKHFTLSRAAKGSDNAFSLEPEPLRRMVNDLRGVRDCLGDGVKRCYDYELPAMRKMGKGLYYSRALPINHFLTDADVAVKSPAGGLKPYCWPDVLGRRLACDVEADEAVKWSHIQGEQEAPCTTEA